MANLFEVVKLAQKAQKILDALKEIDVEDLKEDIRNVIVEAQELFAAVTHLGAEVVENLLHFGIEIPDFNKAPEKPEEKK